MDGINGLLFVIHGIDNITHIRIPDYLHLVTVSVFEIDQFNDQRGGVVGIRLYIGIIIVSAISIVAGIIVWINNLLKKIEVGNNVHVHSEVRIFFQIGLRLLSPGLVTVVLFTLVATWNNYFLPLIMLNDPSLYPVTVGLASWAEQAAGGGAGANGDMLTMLLTGSTLSIAPLMAAFLLLQRYWQTGLATGAIKE